MFSPSPAGDNDDDNDDDDDDAHYYYYPLSKQGNPKQDLIRAGLIYQSDLRKIFMQLGCFLHINSGLRGERVLSIMNDC